MATTITDECINCDACVAECPNDAISEGDDIYVIDAERCTECVGFFDHYACQEVCPVECCVRDPDKEESEDVLAKRGLELHPDDDELKSKIESGEFPSIFRA